MKPTKPQNRKLKLSIAFFYPPLEEQNQIIILNPQSYPPLGGNWTVRFEIQGQADLTIKAVDGIEFGKDLEFLGIKCGSQTLEYEWINSSVFVQNYSCNSTGYEIPKVLTTGKQTLYWGFSKMGSEDVLDISIAAGDTLFQKHKKIYLK